MKEGAENEAVLASSAASSRRSGGCLGEGSATGGLATDPQGVTHITSRQHLGRRYEMFGAFIHQAG